MNKKKSSQKVVITQPRADKFEIKEPEWTSKQLEFIKTCLNKDNNIIFVDGPAGTSKTFMSTYVGLKLLQQRKVSKFLYVRTVIESASKSLGYLPGGSEDKFDPFMQPLTDKLDEFITKPTRTKLLSENIEGLPVNFMRGRSFNNTFLVTDESQNCSIKELLTIITRIGKHSKFIICGDSMQNDINGKSGFKEFYNLFVDQESRDNGIRVFKFGIEDVMRSDQCKFILERMEEYIKKKNKTYI